MRAGSQRLSGIILLTILFAATSYADTFTFSTIPPSGAISGAAGSTVGWGYSVTNNSVDQWLLFNSLVAGGFTNGTPYSEVFDFPVVAPGETITTDYDGVSGLFGFKWNDDAPAGSFNSGSFVLSAELYSGDPFDEFAPGESLGEIVDFSVPYSVTVPVSCNCTPVPEASSFQLLACGVGGIGALLFSLNRKKLRDAA